MDEQYCGGYCVERAAAVKSRVAASERPPESFATRAAAGESDGAGARCDGGPISRADEHAKTYALDTWSSDAYPGRAGRRESLSEKEAHMTTTTSLSAR